MDYSRVPQQGKLAKLVGKVETSDSGLTVIAPPVAREATGECEELSAGEGLLRHPRVISCPFTRSRQKPQARLNDSVWFNHIHRTRTSADTRRNEETRGKVRKAKMNWTRPFELLFELAVGLWLLEIIFKPVRKADAA